MIKDAPVEFYEYTNFRKAPISEEIEKKYISEELFADINDIKNKDIYGVSALMIGIRDFTTSVVHNLIFERYAQERSWTFKEVQKRSKIFKNIQERYKRSFMLKK